MRTRAAGHFVVGALCRRRTFHVRPCRFLAHSEVQHNVLRQHYPQLPLAIVGSPRVDLLRAPKPDLPSSEDVARAKFTVTRAEFATSLAVVARDLGGPKVAMAQLDDSLVLLQPQGLVTANVSHQRVGRCRAYQMRAALALT